MHRRAALLILRVAGEFFPADHQIVAAVELRRDAQRPQRVHHRGDVLRERDLRVLVVVDECELPAAEVCVDRPAAGQPPHHLDAVLLGVGLVDLLERILVFTHHKRGRGAPEEKHRLIELFLRRKIQLQAEVKIDVVRACFDVDHTRPSAASNASAARYELRTSGLLATNLNPFSIAMSLKRANSSGVT